MVPISLRMKTIADMVPEGLSIADIGCDHGFVSIYMVTDRKAPFALAMDVNDGPLVRAKEHITEYGLEDVISTRLSDGAKRLEVGETDAAIIAGMGGRLICRILEDSVDKFKAMKCFVLSPHSDIPFVRHFLYEQGFAIEDEEMVFDEGKYYVSMRCVGAEHGDELNCLQEEYGPILIDKKHPVLKAYLENEQTKMSEIVERLKAEAGVASSEKNEAIYDRIVQIEGKLEGIESLLKDL